MGCGWLVHFTWSYLSSNYGVWNSKWLLSLFLGAFSDSKGCKLYFWFSFLQTLKDNVCLLFTFQYHLSNSFLSVSYSEWARGGARGVRFQNCYMWSYYSIMCSELFLLIYRYFSILFLSNNVFSDCQKVCLIRKCNS